VAGDRRRIPSGSPYEDRYGFSRAVVAGDRVIVSGTAPIPPEGGSPPATAYEQMNLCGRIIARALEEAGASLSDVVRTRMYITDAAWADAVGRAHREVFGDARPAATMVVVDHLLEPGWMVEVEAEAIMGSTRRA
jgi:enamine deaminase RidA (YjgF/YER057c/UK114 family)